MIPLQEGGSGEVERVQQAARAAGEHPGVLPLQEELGLQLLGENR